MVDVIDCDGRQEKKGVDSGGYSRELMKNDEFAITSRSKDVVFI